MAILVFVARTLVLMHAPAGTIIALLILANVTRIRPAIRVVVFAVHVAVIVVMLAAHATETVIGLG